MDVSRPDLTAEDDTAFTIELANGYHELTDAAEQRARFETDNARRRPSMNPAALRRPRISNSIEAFNYYAPSPEPPSRVGAAMVLRHHYS